MSDRMIDSMQEDFEKKLAKRLGITPYELDELGYNVGSNETNDGLVTGHYVEFEKQPSEELAQKIIGYDENANCVFFPPDELFY